MATPKHTNVSLKAGPPRTEVVSPGAVSRIGQLNQTKPPPLIQRTAPDGRMGNDLAMGPQGPGGGREVHRSGSQSPTPAAQPIPASGVLAPWHK